jgi:hypothetical protein
MIALLYFGGGTQRPSSDQAKSPLADAWQRAGWDNDAD